MVNYNGSLVDDSGVALQQNRGFLYGDSVFETIKVLDSKVLFLEDHYFRLMASMRIVRMEIPMGFTMEYFEEQILNLIRQLDGAQSIRVRFSVFRKSGGFYLPTTNDVEFIVTAEPLESALYSFDGAAYEVELFKDFYVTKQLLSTIKSNNRLVQITGSVFAHENGYDNCLLMNDEKNVVEGLQGNLFMLMGNKLVTPPVLDGCLNGVMRKQILAIAKKMEGLEVVEESISPFDLQKADELFLTNVIKGIQPITKYRKKEYKTEFASELLKKLNAQVRLA
ncbi:putative 4-amino-4-deoxychorismate lyase [Flavobacterium enshiense DK69]|uniref:branched-chain-amino-acid transaminase n=1 Tax=Flavobacterium enshiense DK69 TaxID=1107311 RepID=V6S8D2_9FLAO|nr:aminotransferase class IV [Flavobacterium enshiense]ESU22916.1 putative 4-amino-4-deoxychorismate lyase [Flavobacterium enshiense DK69]KGO93933.1 aminotransferase class IV [Flavobacterium enshiense DK69]